MPAQRDDRTDRPQGDDDSLARIALRLAAERCDRPRPRAGMIAPYGRWAAIKIRCSSVAGVSIFLSA